MIKPPEIFEIELNGITMKIEELDIPKYTAFRVVFSSKRKPLVVARTKDFVKDIFWTSIPEGRQSEAEGVGKLIENHFKQKDIN